MRGQLAKKLYHYTLNMIISMLDRFYDIGIEKFLIWNFGGIIFKFFVLFLFLFRQNTKQVFEEIPGLWLFLGNSEIFYADYELSILLLWYLTSRVRRGNETSSCTIYHEAIKASYTVLGRTVPRNCQTIKNAWPDTNILF